MSAPAGKLTEPYSPALTVTVLEIFSPLSFVATTSTVKSPLETVAPDRFASSKLPKLATVDSRPLAVFCGWPMAKSGSVEVSIQLLKSSLTSLRSAPAETRFSLKFAQRENWQSGCGCGAPRLCCDCWVCCCGAHPARLSASTLLRDSDERSAFSNAETPNVFSIIRQIRAPLLYTLVA